MQKAVTGVLDGQAVAQPQLTKLLDIAVDDKNMVYVNWPVDKKELCITALCEAIKLVAQYQTKIIVPKKPNFMDFIRGKK